MLDPTCCEFACSVVTAVDVEIQSMYSRDGPRPTSKSEQPDDTKVEENELDEPMEVVEVFPASEDDLSRSTSGIQEESRPSGDVISEDTKE